MPSSRTTYAWTQFTWAQIDALLKLAAAVDRQPGQLNRCLPAIGDRAAFRAAIASLAKLKAAGEEVQ